MEWTEPRLLEPSEVQKLVQSSKALQQAFRGSDGLLLETGGRFFTCYNADGGFSMREAMSSAALQPVTEVELLRQLQSSRAFRVQNTRSVLIPSSLSVQLMSCPSANGNCSCRRGWHGREARLER
ncbi:unnamed protein product [Symbiodinium sp. CCMP2592]|nr:unnamed protein product [Symbiodinium sp. CCMP2592]